MQNASRRQFLKSAGAAALVGTTAVPAAAATPAASAKKADDPYIFFNADEARFIEAAVARLIPFDETGPGAIEAGVPNYLDKQLGGAWGAGERLYRSGPWCEGQPTQGYELPYTPAELFDNPQSNRMRRFLSEVL